MFNLTKSIYVGPALATVRQHQTNIATGGQKLKSSDIYIVIL